MPAPRPALPSTPSVFRVEVSREAWGQLEAVPFEVFWAFREQLGRVASRLTGATATSARRRTDSACHQALVAGNWVALVAVDPLQRRLTLLEVMQRLTGELP